MTDKERDLYIEAVNLAYEQGIWTKFVMVSTSIVADTKTETQAACLLSLLVLPLPLPLLVLIVFISWCCC